MYVPGIFNSNHSVWVSIVERTQFNSLQEFDEFVIEKKSMLNILPFCLSFYVLRSWIHDLHMHHRNGQMFAHLLDCHRLRAGGGILFIQNQYHKANTLSTLLHFKAIFCVCECECEYIIHLHLNSTILAINTSNTVIEQQNCVQRTFYAKSLNILNK